LNFPISEYSSVGLNYTYEIAQVVPFGGAPLVILEAAGQTYGSIFGYSYGYNTLDDARKPTKGVAVSFSQGFSGFGGNLKFIKTQATLAGYKSLFNDSVVGSLTVNSGYITGYDGAIVPINQRFFEGGDTFRGCKLAGIGPRDIDAPLDQGAVGGNVFAIGTLAARLPSLLPESYGINLGLFTDFGTLGRIDNVIRACTPNTTAGQGTCVMDNLAFRSAPQAASASNGAHPSAPSRSTLRYPM
jgi:outer membrane protein insertion porin family